jgi:hypothetical protein
MRYDHYVYFCTDGKSEYDPDTGDYTNTEPVKVKRPASISPTSDEKIQIIYGQMVQGSLTVQLQNQYNDPFDYILIDGKKYHVDRRKKLRVKDVFVASEVM